MNAGKWDYTTWGYPTYQRIPHDAHPGVQMIGHGEEGVGTGAELWARLRGEKTVQSEKEAQRYVMRERNMCEQAHAYSI